MKTANPSDIGQVAANTAVGEGSRQQSPKRSALLDALLSNANLLNNDEAAAYLGVTPRTLEVWRSTKRHNIAYIKVGRLVKYTKKSLDEFLASRTVAA